MATSRPRITAAICAYNEAQNIGALLRTLLSRDADAFDELLVVSSGSTDGTDDVVRSFLRAAPSLRLITQPDRRGKASAVNLVITEAKGDAILLIDADVLPVAGALRCLTDSLADPGVGGAGARNVVTNVEEGWVARVGEALWELHHLVNLRAPVLGGDIVAFRRVLPAIADSAVNDDYAIEAALRGAGYRIQYEPEARVLMRAPSNVRDFLRQRRRIFAGFRAETQPSLLKPTRDRRLALRAVASFMTRRPRSIPALAALLALEALARLWVYGDAALGRRPYYTAWEPVFSTKGPVSHSQARERSP